MIAPLRPTPSAPNESQARMRLARRAVAQSLLPRAEKRNQIAPVAAWKVALLVAWMSVAAIGYVTRLLGLWD